MLNYNHLFYFHVAASEGSLAKAADRLGVTQPTVSEQIRQLERKLGVTLFARSTAGLRLTERGRQAYQHTTPMFREGERLLHLLHDIPKELTRSLRVGVTAEVAHNTVSTFLLPLFDVAEATPIVRTADLADLVRELSSHQLDLLLCDVEPSVDASLGLTSIELYRPRLVAIAAPDLQVREDWSGTPIIQYSNGSSHRWEIEAFVSGHALRPRVAAELDDPALMLEATMRGKAVAFVPRAIARDAIAAGKVRALAILEPNGTCVHAVYHDSVAVAEAVKRLTEHVRQLED